MSGSFFYRASWPVICRSILSYTLINVHYFIMTCFLIDDDLDDQEFFTIALETISPEIKCLLADDGSEAITKFRSNEQISPDLIFLDMRMPRMNGADTIKEIKKIDRLKNVPTILYSTSDTEIGTEEARKAGADYFFTKPTSIPDLAKVLNEVINNFSHRR
jgi:CheY-like chemotaxis protein